MNHKPATALPPIEAYRACDPAEIALADRIASCEDSLECPYCFRIMSKREAQEQHICNDCMGANHAA